MFVSNTATTIMLVPNAIQVIRGLAEEEDAVQGAAVAQHASVARLEKAVLLAIAYSASIGGMASLIGELTDSCFLHISCTSAFNLTFSSHFLYTEMNRICHKPCLRRAIPDYFPRCNRNIFYQMAWFGNPHWCDYLYVHLCLSVLRYIRTMPPLDKIEKNAFKTKYTDLGAWTREQKIVGALFLIEIILWLSRPGWSNLFPNPDDISDTTVGMFIGILLFVIPANALNLSQDAITLDKSVDGSPKMTTILDWKTAVTLPWDIGKYSHLLCLFVHLLLFSFLLSF